jgi:hypothetical protein
MHGHFWYLLGMALLWGIMAAAGVAAVRTGWTAPWMRSRMRRPKLWGYGVLLMTAGMIVWITAFTVGGASETVVNVGFACSMPMLLAGGVLQAIARRRGRVHA